jgi:hypothetical protein
VALVARGAGDAERDLVVEIAVVSDLGGLAHDNTHAVIEHDAPAELGRRVDLDAREEAREVRDHAPQEPQPVRPQPVREPVPELRVQPWIAEQHFEVGARGGVALPVCSYGLTQKHECHATNPLCIGGGRRI